MDYFSQYTFAEISANMIGEIAYTETLTFWSTLISAPLAYFGSWAVSAGVSKLASEAGASAIKSVILSQKSVFGGLVGTITSPIQEVFQEIIEDGFREALIENLVDIAGGSDALGFWLSSLSTSVREVKGALGGLVLGAPSLSLKNMFTLIQGRASGDSMTEIREKISLDLKQKQEAAQQAADQMGFLDKLLNGNFLKGLFMVLPTVFFGTFSFVAMSGLNKMTSSLMKLSPTAHANFETWQHNRRKEATIKTAGDVKFFSAETGSFANMEKQTKMPLEVDSKALHDLFAQVQESEKIGPPTINTLS